MKLGLKPDYMLMKIPGEEIYLIFNIRDGTVFKANATTAQVVKGIQKEHSVERIAEDLTGSHRATLEEALEVATEAIEILKRNDIIYENN